MLEEEQAALASHLGREGEPKGARAGLGAKPVRVRGDQDLRVQALRLPPSGKAELEAYTQQVNINRDEPCSVAEVTRGIVLLGVHCGRGFAGRRLALAFRLVALDPTEQGVRRALEELRRDCDAEPDTEPEPTKRCA
jgi:hypothetical protein